ncbi:Apolipoprotein N-acyltransferase [Roseibium hamelinense]|uniref:Apolipoprotein N-acyltransferase n=1 Tax=Roseibium hamelinense TaxID=150831 RepID=A0A562T267_9HYPH|nr:apolipoprotein N-acyltransferase [Roseibium hamelinense]MTI44669.1 apolipoprotein N-acyltransferase [Roseibium hamelinense]TWI87298.1 Apolipoprotein N-acyltransferase [Roseibium hamelinense]
MNSLSQTLLALPHACLLSWGWRRRGLALAAGGIAAFALPPYELLSVLLLAFSMFVWLLDGAIRPKSSSLNRFRTGFAVGWWFGFGYFLSGLWWIGAAFLVEADRFAWMIPFAVLAMPVGLALFVGLGAGLAGLLWSTSWQRVLALGVGLSCTEWLRGHVLTGFPWNAFGYGVSGSLSLSQTASTIGIYGLSLLVVCISATPATLLDPRSGVLRRAAPLATAGLVLAGLFGFGAARLSEGTQISDQVDIRIVQPSIDQSEKWRPENRNTIFQTYLELSQKPLVGAGRIGRERIIVWPESAVPFLLTREPKALFEIGRALPDKTTLITGAVRLEGSGPDRRFFNSVYVVDSSGTVQDLYDKVRLVPFGEYLPLESILSRLGITAIVDTPSAFKAGTRQKALTLPEGGTVLPLICYEAIFPYLSGYSHAASAAEGPEWLLNVTNDAWFGRTPGPYQHFAQSRFRAIEQGIPLVRAANTGLSAVVDAKGRVVSQMELFEVGVIDTPLPLKINDTLYGRFGDIPFTYLVLLSLILLIWQRYNQSSRQD